MDISASGVRVRSDAKWRIPVGKTVAVVLESTLGAVEAVVRVVWARKVGWFRYEAGLEFVDMTPEARGALADVAKAGVNQTA